PLSPFSFHFSVSKKITPFGDFSCTYQKYSLPLSPIPTLEGNMSCEKRFAKGLSWVGFGHIK
ncbi:MAG: hypothetical protein J6S09_04985, partial [Paludibacteraceae bacterium]|nr:hypothetical protein [Paludibacteraceae bacterium]